MSIEAALAQAPTSWGYPVSGLTHTERDSDWWMCTKQKWPVGLVGSLTEDITSGCAGTAIGLYLAYRNTGAVSYLTAFDKMVDYIKTRSDLNPSGSYKPSTQIVSLIKKCKTFPGDQNLCDL